MSTELNQLILDVADLDRSIGFYVDLLQLELCETARVDGHWLAMLRAGGTRLLLIQQLEPEASLMDVLPKGVVLNFKVSNLSGFIGQCTKRGTPILRGIERASNGDASMLIADPDGYALLLSGRSELVH